MSEKENEQEITNAQMQEKAEDKKPKSIFTRKKKNKSTIAVQLDAIQDKKSKPTKVVKQKKKKKVKPVKKVKNGTKKPVTLRVKQKFSKMFPKKVPEVRPSAIFKKLPEGTPIIESYDIDSAYSKINIVLPVDLGGGKAYYVEEIELTESEKKILTHLDEIINKEIEPPKNIEDPSAHVSEEARRLAYKYGLDEEIEEESWPRILYYLNRNLVGYGDIDAIMKDPMIEDISVNGVGMPVYIWHRKYESIPTNLIYDNEVALNNLIIKLTHMASKHISTAFPVLDAMLPGKDRLAATFKREVSPKGGSISIRRFREEPYSIIDLMELGTINEDIAAYFWLLIENRMTVAVIGGTGAGKTSTLNALASLVRPTMKIVTVEEIPELNLPHENWVQLVSRESYGLGTQKAGEVSLFNLVKTSLRYRPDYIVVGEIRGEEAFVLFQALATGHGGLTTFHADSLDSTVKRLTSPPMNVAEPYIPLVNVAALVERVQLPTSTIAGVTFGRRLQSVVEVVDYEDYLPVAQWNPLTDDYTTHFDKSEQLGRLAERHGVTVDDLIEEIKSRAVFLKNLKAKGIRKNDELARNLNTYYSEAKNLRIQPVIDKFRYKGE